TQAGAKLRGEIEGFRMYLDAAEKNRMEATQAADMAPDLFEKYLPYAIALDVENSWSRRFASETARAARGGDNPPNGRAWYDSADFQHFGDNGFFAEIERAMNSSGASSSRTSSRGRARIRSAHGWHSGKRQE